MAKLALGRKDGIDCSTTRSVVPPHIYSAEIKRDLEKALNTIAAVWCSADRLQIHKVRAWRLLETKAQITSGRPHRHHPISSGGGCFSPRLFQPYATNFKDLYTCWLAVSAGGLCTSHTDARFGMSHVAPVCMSQPTEPAQDHCPYRRWLSPEIA